MGSQLGSRCAPPLYSTKFVAKKISHELHRFHERTTMKAIFIRSGEPQDHGNLVVNSVLPGPPPRHEDTKDPWREGQLGIDHYARILLRIIRWRNTCGGSHSCEGCGSGRFSTSSPRGIARKACRCRLLGAMVRAMSNPGPDPGKAGRRVRRGLSSGEGQYGGQ